MEKKDYDKLNGYLNDIFLTLEENDSFLLRNILDISYINCKYLSFISGYDLSENLKENKLTYQDVFEIGREIIASIDKEYLEDYDDLIKSGKLDFGYNREYNNSYYIYENDLIDVDREFNYEDVVALVHEFIHHTNGQGELSLNRYLLTEFLSIYFEIYALECLLKSGIPKDEVSIYGRLKNALDNAKNIYSYENIFLAYEKFGAIDKDTSNYLNKYNFLSISQEVFEIECEDFLQQVIKKENEYKKQLEPQSKYKRLDFIEELCLPFFDNYKYFFGILMTYYARKYCKFEDIVYLNNVINYADIGELDISVLLEKVGINIKEEDFVKKIFESIEDFIGEYSYKKCR